MLFNTYGHYSMESTTEKYLNKSENRSKRIWIPVMLSCLLSDKYFWERYKILRDFSELFQW